MDEPGGEEAQLLRQLQSQRRRSRIIIIGFLSLLGVGPFVPIGWTYYQRWQEARANRLTADEEKELRRHLDRMASERTDCDQAWDAAVAKMESLELDDAPCSVNLMAPTLEAGKSYVQHGSIDGNYFGSWSLRLIRPGEAIGHSSSCAFTEWEAQQTREQLDRGDADKDTLAWARRTVQYPRRGNQVLVKVTDESKPMGKGQTFVAGHIIGRVFVYSDDLRRFVCGATVLAHSSANVDIRFSYMKGNFLDEQSKASAAANGALARDLEVQLRRAISEQARAISSPKSPDPI